MSEPATDERKLLLPSWFSSRLLPFLRSSFSSSVGFLGSIRDRELLRAVQTLVECRLIVLSYTRKLGCRQLTEYRGERGTRTKITRSSGRRLEIDGLPARL